MENMFTFTFMLIAYMCTNLAFIRVVLKNGMLAKNFIFMCGPNFAIISILKAITTFYYYFMWVGVAAFPQREGLCVGLFETPSF